MTQSDLTIVFDDRFRQHLCSCTLCSLPLPTGRVHYGTYDYGPWSVDTALCTACVRQPQAWEQVLRKMDRRYRDWGAEGPVLPLKHDMNNGTSTEEIP